MLVLRRLALLLVAVLALGAVATVSPAAAAKKCPAGKARSGGKCVKKCPKGTAKKKGRCVKRKVAAPAPPPAPPAPSVPSGPVSGAYTGENEQSRALSFTVSGGQVVDFVAGVNTFCTTSGNNRYEFDAIANVPPLPIAADGTFSWQGDSDSGNAEITGKITGGTATGTVGMSRGDSTYGPDGLVFGTCSAHDVAWTATAG